MSNNDYPVLSRALDGFLVEKRSQGRSEDTIHDYLTNLNRFIQFVKDLPLNRVTDRNLKEFFIYLDNYQFSPGHTGNPGTLKKLSPKTIKNARTALSSFFAWINSEYGIEMANLPKRSATEVPIEPFSPDEIERIFKACDYSYHYPKNRKAFKVTRPTNLRDRAVISILFDTGVRSSELCGMRFRDLELENYRIHITGKGRKKRTVYIGKSAVRALWKYHSKRYPKEKPHPDDYLFLDYEDLRPMNRDSVRQLVTGIGERANVPDCHPHRFRHTFACDFLRNGGNLSQLQDLMGHTSLKMTKRYLSVVEKDLKDVHRIASPLDNFERR
jgi:integrase/recombinase XerD